jgi:uncharacterized protein YggE
MSARKVILVFAGLAVALFATACGEGDTIINTPGAEALGISVSGTGEAFGEPDIALITLGVQAQAEDVATAREEAAATAQALIDSVKANGVAERDIQTTQFEIQPQYDFSQGRSPTIIGYEVTNVLTIRVRKIDSTSKILDDATAAGGNSTVVRSVSFTIDDPTELRAEARSLALKEARAKAEQLANDAGVSLGDVLSISENIGFSPQPAALDAIAAPRTGAATPIETGELQVSVTVSVRYDID